MSTLKWECDICENPRYSSQILKCVNCNKEDKLTFVGYCCKSKHSDQHIDQVQYVKVNRSEASWCKIIYLWADI